MPGRTIAIGDIHGCSAALDALLDAIRPRPEDTIVTLGDYIDRGPDSRGVLDRLIDLGRRCRLVPLLGNHDQMLLGCPLREVPDLLAARHRRARRPSTPTAPGVTSPSSPTSTTSSSKAASTYHETDTHIFVHANYFPDMPMAEQPVGMLRWESLRDMTPGPHDSGKTVIVGTPRRRAARSSTSATSSASTPTATAAAG